MLPDFPGHWRIETLEPLADGIGGKVWRVTLEDGRAAVLKQASAAALEEMPGAIDYLRWTNGLGSVRLLDAEGDLVMLEWAGERSLQDHLLSDGDEAATEVAADVLSRLHADRAALWPGRLMPLRDNFAGLFSKAERDRRAGSSTQYVRAAEVAQVLLDSQQDVTPLHGDIHHQNILLSERGWLAIDPKGLVGDAAFDFANLFYNPIELDLRYDEARVLSMAATLERTARCDIGRVLSFAFAFSALSASWHEEDGNHDEAARSLAVGRAVGAALSF